MKAKNKGQREFDGWDFEENGSAKGLNLKGISFKNCFLFLDFSESNLEGASFVACNMKTADFSRANLKNAFIKKCLIESIILDDANTENLRAIENYSFGTTLSQRDFESIHFSNYVEPISKITKEDQALQIAQAYIKNNPRYNYKVENVQRMNSWIDGNKNYEDPVWVVNCINLTENPFEGNNFLSVVIGEYTGRIEDLSSH